MNEDASESRLREGAVVAGKYALTHTLGRGGMGHVIAATHLQLERPVAIKFLLPEHLAKPEVVARFTREARAAGKIQSEHVAHVLDVGIDHGTPYMVMEYLEGEDLKQTLVRRGPLSVEESVRYVRQACEGLAEAHALGIVHRDLKPANLFLATRANGRSLLKVLDFGISKVMNPITETELTLTSRAIGSPSYMCPEQLTASRSLDSRADIWSLGVVLYELVSRKRPFAAESMPSLVALILKGQFTPLSELGLNVPEGVVAAVHKCLELLPDDRFASVAELSEALAPFAPTDSFSAAERISRDSIASIFTRGSLAKEPVAEHGQTGIASVVTPAVRVAAPKKRARAAVAGVAVAAFALAAAVTARLSGLGSPVLPPRATTPPSTFAAVAAVPAVDVSAARSGADSSGSTLPDSNPPNPRGPDLAPGAAMTPGSGIAPGPAFASTATGDSQRPAAVTARESEPVLRAARPFTTARALHPASVPPKPANSSAGVSAPLPASAPASSPECHVVSYFDAVGDKHFKQECP